jgi:amino acid adenylation domain-containing protein
MTEAVFPTSFGQERLWFLEQLEPDTAAYNLGRAFRITGSLDRTALVNAFQAVVSRHEPLRTVFTFLEGEPKQVVLPDLDLDIPTVDLGELPFGERQQAALRLAGEETRKPFDLSTGPLLRVKLVRAVSDEHVLVVVMHHIVTDGWSMGVLFSEVARHYETLTTGRNPQLPELSIRYSDFSRWQRNSVTGEFLAGQLKYWKNKLQGAETILDLPTDHPRPSRHVGHGRSLSFQLDQETTSQLKTLALAEGATLFMVLLAVFQVLLWRYTLQDSILVGTTTAGRNAVELENLIGLFVSTVILRADFHGDLSFLQLLKQVRCNALEAFTQQDVPFERLVEALKPERTGNRNPLFQVMFVFQNMPRPKLELSGLAVEEIEFESGLARFDLSLEIFETDGLYCTFEYDSDLLAEMTVRRMIGHFRKLAKGFIGDPDQKISSVPLLTEEEVQQFLDWNNTAAEYPRDLYIHTAFEQQAVRTPDAVAILDEDQRLTYRQLNQSSNRLARRLIEQGVSPGDLVGISLKRSLQMVIGLLGILKAGAAYVPLDPSQPKQRLALMLEDSQARWVVTNREFRDAFRGSGVDAVLLDDGTAPAEEGSSDNPSVTLPLEGHAYVIYTSGSTGTPKGVEGTHRASMNRFAWMWEKYPFAAGETCCQKTPLGFVDSIWEIFGPLLRGVRNVIIPEKAMLDPEQLIGWLAQYEITRLVLVPSLLRVMLEQVNDLQERLPRLKLWSCSGESLSPDLAKRFLAVMPRATLLNIYGSSEVAADATWHEVTQQEDSSVPIGRPIYNTQVYILDRYLNRVPLGVRGEICVGGDCLALGYWKRPELTSERFVANPFKSTNSTTLLYKTGDLGRYLPDGNVEYLRRVDDQVKIRGVRVELGEIETVLASHPLVRSAVVILAGADADQEQLVAYLVARAGRAPVANELRRFLRSRVPDYMVPSRYMIVDALPLLPSGKVDRKALSLGISGRSVADHGYVAPQTETQEKLAEIWREVLGTEQMGIEDNFFELGGHSLMVIRVVARIRKVFGVEVPVVSLFEEPTIAGLAGEVEEAKAKGITARIPILPGGGATPTSDREALLARLDKLPEGELQELLKRVLQDKGTADRPKVPDSS